MSGNVGVDRRILRAFYTQYVAVLLILLVFCVGSVCQGTLPHRPATAQPDTRIPLASVRYSEFFQGVDSAEINESGGINAVSQVLRSHDLRGVFAISAPLSGDAQAVAASASLRAKTLRARTSQDHVPAQAIKIVVVPSTHPSGAVTVSFESLEVSDGES
jgi:hypothetical protein